MLVIIFKNAWNQIDGNTSIDEIVNRLFYDMEIQGASFDEVKKDICSLYQ